MAHNPYLDVNNKPMLGSPYQVPSENIYYIEQHSAQIQECLTQFSEPLILTDEYIAADIYPRLQSLFAHPPRLIMHQDKFEASAYDLIIGLGGGSVLDWAKRQAYLLQLPWVAIPTKPTCATFTSIVSVKDASGIQSLVTTLPTWVIVPLTIIGENGWTQIVWDYFDTWSFQTAAMDVLTAHLDQDGEWDSSYIKIFNQATKDLLKISTNDLKMFLVQLLSIQNRLSQCMNKTQSTHYVSGIEHLIAHSMAAMGLGYPHGQAVGFGILIGRMMQSAFKDIFDHAVQSGFNYTSYQAFADLSWRMQADFSTIIQEVDSDLLFKILQHAHHVRSLPRYSILNRFADQQLETWVRDNYPINLG